MVDRWYREAVIYCVQVDLFCDSGGDGCGDLRGLTGRLDYLSQLGITCLGSIRSIRHRFATVGTTSRTTTGCTRGLAHWEISPS